MANKQNFDSIIESKFLLPNTSISEKTLKKCEEIIKGYGDNCVKWVWGPNASDTRALDPPSGFSMKVKCKSPIKPLVFHPQKMFYGTVAVKLDGATFKDNGERVNDARLIKTRDMIKKNIDHCIKESTEKPARISNKELETGYEKESWNESLGSGGAYAGIFSSTSRGDYLYKKGYWLVVQSGSSVISEDLYSYMEEISSDEKVTWYDFFLNDQNTLYANDCIKKNRSKLLARLFEAIGLEFSTKSRSVSEIIEPTVETISHTVDIDGEFAICHSNTIDPELTTCGILFNENPYLGPTLLKGPPNVQSPFGLSWSAENNAHGTFATCTGRIKQLPLNAENKMSFGDDQSIAPFIWEGKQKLNARLGNGVYRSRTVDFKKIESTMGYKHVWGEIAMQPLVVKVANHCLNFTNGY